MNGKEVKANGYWPGASSVATPTILSSGRWWRPINVLNVWKVILPVVRPGKLNTVSSRSCIILPVSCLICFIQRYRERMTHLQINFDWFLDSITYLCVQVLRERAIRLNAEWIDCLSVNSAGATLVIQDLMSSLWDKGNIALTIS